MRHRIGNRTTDNLARSDLYLNLGASIVTSIAVNPTTHIPVRFEHVFDASNYYVEDNPTLATQTKWANDEKVKYETEYREEFIHMFKKHVKCEKPFSTDEFQGVKHSHILWALFIDYRESLEQFVRLQKRRSSVLHYNAHFNSVCKQLIELNMQTTWVYKPSDVLKVIEDTLPSRMEMAKGIIDHLVRKYREQHNGATPPNDVLYRMIDGYGEVYQIEKAKDPFYRPLGRDGKDEWLSALFINCKWFPLYFTHHLRTKECALRYCDFEMTTDLWTFLDSVAFEHYQPKRPKQSVIAVLFRNLLETKSIQEEDSKHYISGSSGPEWMDAEVY